MGVQRLLGILVSITTFLFAYVIVGCWEVYEDAFRAGGGQDGA